MLGHGAGGHLDDVFLAAMATGLAARGFATLRFNFPYRQEGRRLPDPAPTLEECFRAAAARAAQLFAPARLLLGGKSLGGRMASHLAAAGETAAGLLFLGYPLHPPGKTERLRDQHLYRIRVPMLFVSGTRDGFARKDLLEPVLERLLPLATAHWVVDGDHSFRVPGRPAQEVYQEILDAVVAWLDSVIFSSPRGEA